MEPLPETLDLLSQFSMTRAAELTLAMQDKADWIVAELPDCVGLSVTLRDHELTFTWLATDDRLRTVDAAQYLAGGPCELAASVGEEVAFPDLLSEERWQLMARAGAAVGVRSSLSLPLRDGEELVGSINLYGADEETFKGAERALATAFHADVEDAVSNADLAMSSVDRARKAVSTLEAIDKISVASGIIAARDDIPVGEALDLIRSAAMRAGADHAAVAELIIANRDQRA